MGLIKQHEIDQNNLDTDGFEIPEYEPDFDVTERVQDTYYRLTGKSFDDLPDHVKNYMWTLPPDADQSDIDFAYEFAARNAA